MNKAPDWRDLRHGVLVGDVLLVVLAIAGVFALMHWSWQGGVASRLRIYQDGRLVQELSLNLQRRVEVAGPLGATVIEIDHGRARIAADPSPRQYCVRAGWLDQAGQQAICLPNHTSIELAGPQGVPFDSLSY